MPATGHGEKGGQGNECLHNLQIFHPNRRDNSHCHQGYAQGVIHSVSGGEWRGVKR